MHAAAQRALAEARARQAACRADRPDRRRRQDTQNRTAKSGGALRQCNLESATLRENLVSLAAAFGRDAGRAMQRGLCPWRDHAVANLPASVCDSRRLASFFFSPHNRLVESCTTRVCLAVARIASTTVALSSSRSVSARDSQLADQKRNPLMYDQEMGNVSIVSRCRSTVWIGRRAE